MLGRGMESTIVGEEQVAASCKHGNKISGVMKSEELFYYLSNPYHLIQGKVVSVLNYTMKGIGRVDV
jgi:hypothetical protein